MLTVLLHTKKTTERKRELRYTHRKQHRIRRADKTHRAHASSTLIPIPTLFLRYTTLKTAVYEKQSLLEQEAQARTVPYTPIRDNAHGRKLKRIVRIIEPSAHLHAYGRHPPF